MTKLTDAWYVSQPAHLRHLAIIRDTTCKGRNKNYVHYSFENFQRLVEENQTSWEAIIEVKGSKKGSEDTSALLEDQPDVDQYGFPRIPTSLLQGQTNSATLRESVLASKVPKFPRTKHDPLEIVLEDGSPGIADQWVFCCVLLMATRYHLGGTHICEAPYSDKPVVG